MSGVKRTAALNVLASALNIITITAALVVMAFFMTGGNFKFDVWGQAQGLGSVFGQVKSTMLVTLWVFIGIEGAVVISDRARKMSQVGPATFIGLGVCTILYSLLSILPFGIMHQGDTRRPCQPFRRLCSKLSRRQMGRSLRQRLAAHRGVELLAGLDHSGRRTALRRCQRRGVPAIPGAREQGLHAAAPSLWISSIVMQATLFVVLFAHNAWLWLIDITGVMVLPPYFASTLYLAVYAARSGYVETHGESKNNALATGILGSVYSLWMLYAAGLQFLLMSTIMFAIGVPVYLWSQREHHPGERMLTGYERLGVASLLAVAVVALVLFLNGTVQIG